MNENITYDVDDPCSKSIVDLDHFLMEFETLKHSEKTDDDGVFAEIKNYDLNYNVKQLLLICEYYGISKGALKTNKMKKQDVIEQIVLFENDMSNFEIVQKRKQMWYYITELRDDKFMKKYILWS